MKTNRHFFFALFFMFVVAQGCQQNADNASKEKKQAYQSRSATTDFDLVILNGCVMDPETNFDGIRNVGAKGGKINMIAEANILRKDSIEGKGLVWADEFDVDGAVASEKWFSEIVPPNNGAWHNDEEQHYTKRSDNAFVSDEILKIITKKEVYSAYNLLLNVPF